MPRPHGVRAFAAAVVSLAVAPVLAHPGHGKDGGSNSLMHYVTEPEHVAPVGLAVLAGVAAAAFVAWYRRRA